MTATADPATRRTRRDAVPSPAPVRAGRSWGGDAAGAAALGSLVVVTALWLHDGGLQQLLATGSYGTADSLTSAGRLLGLLASDLLLLQCLLLARIPWVERTWGQDRLVRWHRWTGFTSFWGMVAHIGVITFGYSWAGDAGAGARLRALAAEGWDLLVSYPGMLLAAAGTACLVMVVVTSVRAARRRLRYESWHLLHLYAYLGVALALPHQLWTGSDFVGNPVATACWWALWAAAATALLVFRLGVPAWHTWHRRLRVAGVVQEAPGVVSVAVRGHRLDRLGWQAGQFAVLRFRDGPGWTRGNPYSLSAAPHPEWMRVTVRDAGDGSARAAHLRPGTRVLLEGPFGRLTLEAREDPTRPVLLVGAGVGTAPLRALFEAVPPSVPALLVQRASREADVLHGEELREIAAASGGSKRTAALVGPRAAGSWLPQEWAHLDDAGALLHLAPWVAGADVYVCGPGPWAQAVERAARRAGVPRSRVHVEGFAW
ncbi:MAG: ferredoxin reductase family protein [Quadrisphaera sp.]